MDVPPAASLPSFFRVPDFYEYRDVLFVAPRMQ
jgi:hypothetical protein